jgi:hypothetical protein
LLTLQDSQTTEQAEADNSESQAPADPAVDAALHSEANTGENTSLDGNSTPPTPRSTPAKPSVFKKATIQKVKLNQDFLKNVSPSSGGPQPTSTAPRPMTIDKRTTHHILTNASKSLIDHNESAQTNGAKPSVESGWCIDAASGIRFLHPEIRKG